MGVLKKKEWTEKSIQDVLTYHFLSASTKKYNIYNLFVYTWESDYLAVTNSNYVYECEIKVTRADFFNDLKNKKEKHQILESETNFGCERPNYFYYAVPEGLVSAEEVPAYAGLIYVKPWGVEVVKEAKSLLPGSTDISELKLVDKFYWCTMNYRQKFDEAEVSYNKKIIRGLQKNIMVYDDSLFDAQDQIFDLQQQIKERDLIIEKLRSDLKPLTD